jgi:hypothetical protein
MSGQAVHRALISGVTNSERCEISTVDPHGFSTGNMVRITDLNGSMPSPRGMDQINNKRFLIYVTGLSSFLIKYPITHEYVNSINYTPWVSGGRVDVEETSYIYEGD